MVNRPTVEASRETRNVRAAYFLTSFPLTSWYSQAAAVQDRLALSDALWGLLLVAAPLVTFCTMRLYVVVVPRRLSHAALTWALTAMAVDVFVIGLLDSYWMLIAALVLLGAANGVLQVESNSRAHLVEELTGRAFFTSCHGFFSIGVLAAGATAFVVAQLGLPTLTHFALVLAVGLVGVVVFRLRPLPPLQRVPVDPQATPGTARPGAAIPLAVLVVFAFVLLAVESSINTWHATFVESSLGLAGYGGAAYAAYAVGGIAIRFSGDFIRARFGPLAVFQIAAPAAAASLWLSLLEHTIVITMATFVLLGIALGIAYPEVLKLGAALDDRRVESRMAKLITAGTLGVILSNPIMGAISDWWSTGWAFGLLATALLLFAGWVVLLRRSRRQPT